MALRALLGRTTPLDRLIVLGLLAAAVATLGWLGGRPAGARVVAEENGQVIFAAPLAQARTVALAGPLGKTILRIRGGRARIVASPCPRKICIGMGAISRQGQMIACVPNHILVRILGKRGGKEQRNYDFISR